MPSIAAPTILVSSGRVTASLPRVSIAAFMNPVPQIGPELPPTFLLTIIEIFSSIAPMLLLSIPSHSFSIARKPVASEMPKSPSPARPSRSQK